MKWALMAMGILGVMLMIGADECSPRNPSASAGAALWFAWAVLETVRCVEVRLAAQFKSPAEALRVLAEREGK